MEQGAHRVAVRRVAGDAAALQPLVGVKDSGPVAGLGRLHELGGRAVDAPVVLNERLELRPEGLLGSGELAWGDFRVLGDVSGALFDEVIVLVPEARGDAVHVLG